jgi:glycosyltransferase involved in cell wall biosynthesis
VNFVYTDIFYSSGDWMARALARMGWLRLHLRSTRRRDRQIPAHIQRSNLCIQVARNFAERIPHTLFREYCRHRVIDWNDTWVTPQIQMGDSFCSEVGYAVAPAKKTKALGGKVVLRSKNSHPLTYWSIVSREYARWDLRIPPVPYLDFNQSLRGLSHTDLVVCPSDFVMDSYIQNGWSPHRLIKIPTPVDLSTFVSKKVKTGCPKIIKVCTTAGLNLRKGSAYLLEALRACFHAGLPIEFHCVRMFHQNFRSVLPLFSDIPVRWHQPMEPTALSSFLRSMDLFILPTLEEGRARTVLEAMASGLPVIITHESGSSDLVEEGINGSIVPAAQTPPLEAALNQWVEKLQKAPYDPDLSASKIASIQADYFYAVFEKAVRDLFADSR